jgi:guanylate kinase
MSETAAVEESGRLDVGSDTNFFAAEYWRRPVRRGIFFLVAGPAGVGKTTLLKQLVADDKNLVKAVSVTTRPAREDEVDGVAYHFWDENRFAESISKGEFLEHAVVHGNHYGTLARFVEEKLAAGIDVIKDIDVQGVHQLRKQERYWYPHTVGIFVMPPSREELVRRLEGRGSEDARTLSTRLRAAEDEMTRLREYEYVVVNDTLEHALEQFKAIRLAEHCRRERVPGW